MSDELKPTGMHLGRQGDFWQINIGHVLTIATILGGLALTAADLVSEFTTLRLQAADQKEAIADVKSSINELRTWRNSQDMQNSQWHAEINQNFEDVKRHLERLDYEVNQSDVPGVAGRRKP